MNENSAIKLYKKSFLEPSGLTQEIFKNFDFKNCAYEIKEGEKTASVGFIRNKKLKINGKVSAFPFLFGLTTSEEFRNKGYAKKLIANIVKDLSSKGRAFLGLYPFPVDKNFYYNFSFSSFSFISKIAIKNLVISGTCVKEDIRVKEIFKLHKTISKNYQIKQDFSYFLKRKRERIFKAFNAKKFGLYYKNYLYGYLCFDGESLEESFFDFNFIEKNKDKILGDFEGENLVNCDLLVTNFLSKFCPSNKVSYALIRPLSYVKFLKAFKKNFDTNIDFTLKLLIKDEILGEQKIKIDSKNKKIKIFDNFLGDDYTILSPKEFTEYVLFSKSSFALPKINKTEFDYAFLDRY